jgi:Undecaprenyl-phosphate glucose phosphotransferase
MFFIGTTDGLPRRWMVLWAVGSMAGLVLVCVCTALTIALCRRAGSWVANVAVLGRGSSGERVATQLKRCGAGDVNIIGVFCPEVASGDDTGNWDIEDLVRLARITRIDEIVIAAPSGGMMELTAPLRKLGAMPIDVKLCPDLLGCGRLDETSIRLHLIPVLGRPFTGWHLVVKRTIDIALSAALLILLLPLMVTIALIIKLDSPGPVLFSQHRFGFNKHPFTVYKFRSMYMAAADDPMVLQAQRNDPRVTRFGRFIRRSSLDELPQLINVLTGDMSLVGPRPHSIVHDEKYALLIDRYLERHRVKPGLTGWAQINGLRGETDTTDKMKRRLDHDLYYIEHWSIFFDVLVLARTLFVSFTDSNAY